MIRITTERVKRNNERISYEITLSARDGQEIARESKGGAYGCAQFGGPKGHAGGEKGRLGVVREYVDPPRSCLPSSDRWRYKQEQQLLAGSRLRVALTPS